MKRARCLSFWICLRNSTLQNPCQSSVHNGHKQRTVQTELQHYCYVSCKVFTSSSHLMPTFQHKMRNMESRNYIWNSLSLYIYGMYRFFIFVAEIIGNLTSNLTSFRCVIHLTSSISSARTQRLIFPSMLTLERCHRHQPPSVVKQLFLSCFCTFFDGFDGFCCVHSRRPSWKNKPFGFPELYMAQFWRCESLLLG